MLRIGFLAVVAVARCVRRVNSFAAPATSLRPPCDRVCVFCEQTCQRAANYCVTMMTGCNSSPGSKASVRSIGSLASLGSIGSIASIGSIGSFASIGSIGSIASIGSVGSIASIGSAGSIASIGSRGAIAGIRTSGGAGTQRELEQMNQAHPPCSFSRWPVYLAAGLLLPAAFLIARRTVGTSASKPIDE
jgi:hypothetical protein